MDPAAGDCAHHALPRDPCHHRLLPARRVDRRAHQRRPGNCHARHAYVHPDARIRVPALRLRVRHHALPARLPLGGHLAATAVRTRVAAPSVRSRVGRRLRPETVGLYALALLALVILLGPLVWMFGTAFKEGSEIFTWPPTVFPKHWHWDNFVQAWQGAHFSRYFINSTIVSLVSVVTNVFLAAIAGYAFARLRFPRRNFLFIVMMITLLVPNASLIIPLFLMMKNVPFTY